MLGYRFSRQRTQDQGMVVNRYGSDGHVRCEVGGGGGGQYATGCGTEGRHEASFLDFGMFIIAPGLLTTPV